MPYRGYPSHLGKPDGRGYRVCDRTGRLRKPRETLREWTGAFVARESADLTPGFGTRHPQDVPQPEIGGDPTPIPDARPNPPALSKEELGISDAEITASVRENRPPRRGF